jgi:hypothetical protein
MTPDLDRLCEELRVLEAARDSLGRPRTVEYHAALRNALPLLLTERTALREEIEKLTERSKKSARRKRALRDANRAIRFYVRCFEMVSAQRSLSEERLRSQIATLEARLAGLSPAVPAKFPINPTEEM